MAKDQSGSIRAGIFTVAGAIIIILFIIGLAQRSQFLTRQYSLIATFVNAGGLLPGAAVRIAGVNAGNVRGIEIVREDSGIALVHVDLNIARSFRQDIRSDSVATIRTLGILGDKYVEISLGSQSAPELADGAPIKSQEAVDYYQVAEEARNTFRQATAIAAEITDTLKQLDKAALVKNLNSAADSLSQILVNAQKGPSLLHSLLYDPDLAKSLDDLRAAAKALRHTAEEVDSGKGGLAEVIHGEKLPKALADFADAMDSAKAVLKQMQTGDGAVHALLYDKTEKQALEQLSTAAEKLNAVMTDIREGKGSLGLLIADPSVWESLQRLLDSANESTVLKFVIQRSLKEKTPK